MKALLIVDMQVGSFSDKTPRFDTKGVVQRINQVSNYFRDQGEAVIFIQHDGTKEKYLFHGTEDWEILPELTQASNDIFIEKTANDSFYNTGLDQTLKKYNIQELYISGCATDFCVNATIHSALVKDFNITIIKDCHTTADRLSFSAEKLILFHNWLWENLTPTKGRIRLLSAHDIIPPVS